MALSASGRSPSQLRLRLASLFGEPVREPLRLSAGGMLTVTVLALALLFGPVSWRSAANSGASDSKPPAEKPIGAKSEKSVAASDRQKAAEATAETGVTAPINVSGRAIDADGKPIAGAKIYIASVRVDWKRIGETTTDASGRYFFRNARLPIARPDTNRGQTNGAFLIYGQADGHGFAWRPTKWYYPQPNSNTFAGVADDDYPHAFQQNEKIELDLRFSPSTTVRGRVVDEGGKPIANTVLAIWDCERIPSSGYRTKSKDLSRPEFEIMDNNGFRTVERPRSGGDANPADRRDRAIRVYRFTGRLPFSSERDTTRPPEQDDLVRHSGGSAKGIRRHPALQRAGRDRDPIRRSEKRPDSSALWRQRQTRC